MKPLLITTLIEQAESLSIVKTEEAITTDLLGRYDAITLVDKYEAYEIFHTGYEEISGDLEIIQNEGIAAVKQVDPNMVTKKKDGQDNEVQDGWKGHLLPFDLVQKTLLKDDLSTLEEK